ncbi:MAG TPA: type II secretion system protein GspM [Rhizomicrobium sp.]|nr:type II secretion system protein GspM [Rhizomicrobium sp.]
MRPLEPRERKVVAVAILIAALVVVWYALINPLVVGFIDRAEERAELQTAYRKNQRVLSGIATWRDEVEEQTATQSQYAIVAPTKVLAAENLKQRLNRLANATGGSVQSVSDLPSENENWVRVRADMQLTMSQLYKSLYRLENEAPYVVVGYVSVVADRAVQTGHLATMDVRIEVSAPVRINQPS